MASRLTLRHLYPLSSERVREVFTDRQYVQAKLKAVGGPRAELVSWEQDAHGVTLVLTQAIPEHAMPSFLRAMLSGGLMIRRTETWSDAGGRVHAAVDGAPGTVTGVMRFAPDPAGCALDAELTAEVPVPLVGANAEKIITSNVAALMDKEYQFTLAWLDNLAHP
jgi:hypothetical protein